MVAPFSWMVGMVVSFRGGGSWFLEPELPAKRLAQRPEVRRGDRLLRRTRRTDGDAQQGQRRLRVRHEHRQAGGQAGAEQIAVPAATAEDLERPVEIAGVTGGEELADDPRGEVALRGDDAGHAHEAETEEGVVAARQDGQAARELAVHLVE